MDRYKVIRRFIVGARVFALGDVITLSSVAGRAHMLRGNVEPVKSPIGPSETKPAEPVEVKTPDVVDVSRDWLERATEAIKGGNGRVIRATLAEVDDEPTSVRKAENAARLEAMIKRAKIVEGM